MQKGIYQREQDELEILSLNANADKILNQSIAFSLSNDTVPEKLDSIATWLETKSNLKSYYRLVPIYINKGEYEKAAIAINELIAEAQTIGGITLENAENYKTLQDIKYQIMQSPENEADIIKANIKELLIIAEGEGKNAGIAQYMLYSYDSETYIDYKETYPLPDPNKALAIQENKPVSYSANNETLINVYPNPTSGQLNIEYINIDNSNNINIYDMQGRVLMTFKAQESFGIQTIDVSGLSKGNYLIGFGKNQTTQFIVK